MSAVEVGRHHAGGEAVFGGVGAANDLRFVGIAEDRHHRAEDLFAHDGHLVAAIGKHRQGRPTRRYRNRRLSAPRRRTAGARLRVCRSRYSAERCRDGEADQRAEVGVVGKQIAGADAGHPLEDLVLEFRLLFRRDKHPGAVGADLTGAVKLAIMAISAARSRSASSAIISGDLPPSSMVTSFSDEAAELAITFCRWRRRR